MMRTNSSKLVCLGFHPSSVFALVGSPSNCSTSAGREIFGVDFHEDFSGLCVDTLLIHSLAFPAQSDAYLSECQCRKFAYGMLSPVAMHEVFGGDRAAG